LGWPVVPPVLRMAQISSGRTGSGAIGVSGAVPDEDVRIACAGAAGLRQ